MTTDPVAPAGTAGKASRCGAFFIARRVLLVLCILSGLSACAIGADSVFVESVIDGDTVRLKGGETVRLLGVNAPEKDRKDQPAQPLSLEATLLLRELVEGRTVRLTKGKEEKDQYQRTLGYLDLNDGTDVQRTLIERGYAFVVAFPPDIDRLPNYVEAERSAKKNRRGVWGLAAYQPISVARLKNFQGGFRLITGEVTKVGYSKKNVRLHLGSKMVIGIRHTAWEEFWNFDAKGLAGKTVVARGWVQFNKKKQSGYLRLRHPAMMEIK